MHTLRAGICLLVLTAATAAPTRAPKRAAIDPKSIRHETGFCYIAGMDFGEEGDRESGSKSLLQLFEDGKPLGPARALHADIRTKGAGRYSHWTSESLYFSASDNTDPRTNGRRYEVTSTHPESTLAGSIVEPTARKTHREVIRGSRRQYEIALGGNLDFENTVTREHGGFRVAFQPNLSLTLENTGDGPVLWPKLIANGERDWSTYESLLADFTRGAANDQEKALFIWQQAREHRYHSLPLFADAEFHDPVKMFNSYGLQLCDDMGYCGASLFKHAGLGKPKYALDPKVRCLNGHMQCEAVVDNAYQFLDIDQDVFYLDRENERPVSGDACARDHDLVRREAHYGPVFPGWGSSDSAAALFGADDRETAAFLRGHEMSYTLRPGEKAIFRWDNVGKWACQSEEWNHRPRYFGNSRFVYRPRLSAEHYRQAASEAADVTPAAGSLAGTSPNGRLVYEVKTPWVICGGALRAEFVGRGAGDHFTLDVKLDEKTTTRVWEGAGAGPTTAAVPIDAALRPHVSPAKYRYQVIVGLASAAGGQGAGLKSLEIETDVMAAPVSLPRLRRGRNTLVYADQQGGPHEITVTHEWQECDTARPPRPPREPASPAPGATVGQSLVPFRWPASEGCRAYHLQVSRRPDFRVPYRPAYDVIVNATEWSVPYTGMFAPDTLYHWRVRARDRRGVWSEWSPAWTFRWEGPRVPVHVRGVPTDRGILLQWEPNPRGTRPVAYEVYGSDEKGFSIHKEAYESHKRGTVPANFLARTTDTSLLVVSPELAHANTNRCYYRVVAVDAAGVESICSDYAEMPHPHIWTRPLAEAVVGKRFTYRPGAITSLNDVQHRYEAPTQRLWDVEENTFALKAGPAWLSLDTKTGALTGTPDAPGKARVEIEARNQFGGRDLQAFELVVR